VGVRKERGGERERREEREEEEGGERGGEGGETTVPLLPTHITCCSLHAWERFVGDALRVCAARVAGASAAAAALVLARAGGTHAAVLPAPAGGRRAAATAPSGCVTRFLLGGAKARTAPALTPPSGWDELLCSPSLRKTAGCMRDSTRPVPLCHRVSPGIATCSVGTGCCLSVASARRCAFPTAPVRDLVLRHHAFFTVWHSVRDGAFRVCRLELAH